MNELQSEIVTSQATDSVNIGLANLNNHHFLKTPTLNQVVVAVAGIVRTRTLRDQ